jgi:hypothetical protein
LLGEGLARRGGAIWMRRLVPDSWCANGFGCEAGVRARTPGRVQADYEAIFNQYAECSCGGAQEFFDRLEMHRQAQYCPVCVRARVILRDLRRRDRAAAQQAAAM